ncbi:MAG: hypothetical protein K1X95_15205 [Acidimicrobiia bacterium]|nr:hypothetical protein [Acidimicrobiia bacterium]
MGRLRAALVAALMASTAATGLAVASPAGADGLPSCDVERHVVVTDVDETLTTSDGENIHQLLDPSYDQKERDDASETFQAYHDKGYWVVYLTARPETLVLRDGRPYRTATDDWFTAHDFPHPDGVTEVYFSPDLLSSLLPRGYKGEVVKALQAQGFQVDYAYGNATTDFQAYKDAGLPLDRTFSIGKLAGWGGTTPIPDGTYTDHLATFLPTVPDVCDMGATPQTDPSVCPPVTYDGLLPWLFRDLIAKLGMQIRSHVLPCH